MFSVTSMAVRMQSCKPEGQAREMQCNFKASRLRLGLRNVHPPKQSGPTQSPVAHCPLRSPASKAMTPWRGWFDTPPTGRIGATRSRLERKTAFLLRLGDPGGSRRASPIHRKPARRLVPSFRAPPREVWMARRHMKQVPGRGHL